MMLYDRFREFRQKNTTGLAVLIDPGKTSEHALQSLIAEANNCNIDFFFVGGSYVLPHHMDRCLSQLNAETNIPVIIFPGHESQINPNARGILLLSLISGRNPDLLIGKHVSSSLTLSQSGLELLPTGYMLIENGGISSVNYISQTLPIPRQKYDLAVATALAGEQLGLRLIYLEAGSGAELPVPPAMIRQVRKYLSIPLIVGGGINSLQKLEAAREAGADLIVVGNVLEHSPQLLQDFVIACRSTIKQ